MVFALVIARLRLGRWPPRAAPWAMACAAWLAVTLWVAPQPVRAAEGTSTLHVQALAAAADSAHFPETAPSSMVELPHAWAERPAGDAVPTWYRIRFTAPGVDAAEPLGVFIERACSALEIHLNGRRVGGHGRLQAPVSRQCYEPQYALLPPGLWRPGENTLDVKLAGFALRSVTSRQRAAGLSPVVTGTQAEVYALYRAEFFVHTTLPQIVSGTLLLLGSVVLVLGWQNRRDRHLAYFGGLCVSWAMVSARCWLTEVPLANHEAEVLISSFVPLTALCTVQFLSRYALWKHAFVDAVLWAQCLVVPLSLWAAGTDHLFGAASAWYALLSLEVLAAMGWCLWLLWRFQRQDFRAMLVLLLVGVALLAVELAAQQVDLPSAVQHLAPFALPLVIVLLGSRLLYQHGRALVTVESSRDMLERRVREATAEVESTFAQMAEMRVEQVTQQERKRIAGDLHDDLGAKLLTIVHTSEDDRISTLAREALEEMRLSVRGLTGKAVRLADALGDWRAEVVSRLSQSGIENEWRSPADELPQTLSARAYVQTTRILREAVSNIIKHSGASHCQVRCRVIEHDFQLVIQDNGRGIPMELDGQLDRGHGMSSMKHRAKQLHGQCLVESGPGYGTVIRLTLPL